MALLERSINRVNPIQFTSTFFRNATAHLRINQNSCQSQLLSCNSPVFHSRIPAAATVALYAAESKKLVFVAGANGKTGKRIVAKLISEGYRVRAGVLDVQKARNNLPNNESVEIVAADVTLEAAKLASLIGAVDAVICASAFRYSLDFLAPWKVDYRGTINLVEACRKNSISKFVLISSILVNGAAWGQVLNPAYVVLNAFGLTLIAKLQAENYIRKSGIDFTIVRPGGLSEEKPKGNIVMAKEDTLSSGSISRDLVAEVAVEALKCPEASYKVVEIVSDAQAPRKSFSELFAGV